MTNRSTVILSVFSVIALSIILATAIIPSYSQQPVILFEELQSITPTGAAANDQFGISTALYDNTILVGAPFNGTGAAYIFESGSNGDYTQTTKLTASDGAADDRFGRSVAIYNGTILVGAYEDDHSGNYYAGSAYVFEKDANDNWTQIQKLVSSGSSNNNVYERFGISVSIHDGIMVVGAHKSSGASGVQYGAAYVFESINGTWTETAKLTAADGAAYDHFGRSVYVYDGTIVVGSYKDDDNGADSGSAYVFENTNSTWSQTAKLTAADGAVGDLFAYSISMHDDIILVGAPESGPNFLGSGAAYAFEKDANGNWSQTAKITTTSDLSGSTVGHSVSVYDDIATISTRSGAAYAFEQNSDGTWSQLTRLVPSGDTSDNNFGYSAFISDGTILAGAPQDDFAGSDLGALYVYSVGPDTEPPAIILNGDDKVILGINGTYTESGATVTDNDPDYSSSVTVGGDTVDTTSGGIYTVTYTAQPDASGNIPVPQNRTVVVVNYITESEKLTASDGEDGDHFGRSVGMDGDIAIVGASRGDDAGAAYSFILNSTSGSWVQTDKIVPLDPTLYDHFARSVSVDDSFLIAGSSRDDDDGLNSGSAYAFEYNPINNTFAQHTKLTADDADANNYFGYSVSLYDENAIIGAPLRDETDEESGAAYVFMYNETSDTWGQYAKLAPTDGEENDHFGWSVSIWEETILVGAYHDDEADLNSGSAYVYEKDSTGTWVQQAKLTASDGQAHDWFGFSVFLNNQTAIIGASEHINAGIDTGAAYIFDFNSTDSTWSQTQKLTASDGESGDQFGYSVGLVNEMLVVGANGDSSAYVFELDNTGTWVQTRKLIASDAEDGDALGISVALSYDSIFVGATLSDSGKGSAYVYPTD
ncbi:MAG: DUF5011 domain-containing protein [Nitrosopumilaceae archaeon]|nr:DUF5011 domain-containing protein [Nitrosopumilaceae archaeon]